MSEFVCGSSYHVRVPDFPADQWDCYKCIQIIGHDGPHFDGGATKWQEVTDE